MIEWNKVTWYSRLGALILFLGIVPVLTFYIGTQYQLTISNQQPKISPIQISENKTTTSSIHVLISNVGLGRGSDTKFPITNTATGDIISTRDSGVAAQNPSSYIFVNQKQVGEIWGYSSSASFSPDNKYFAVLETMDEGCAGNCFSFNVPIINLTNNTMLTIQPQPAPHDEFIESYTWDGDNAIDVTSYYISYSGGSLTTNPDYYRISPKQVWRYNVTTGSSTLISTTP